MRTGRRPKMSRQLQEQSRPCRARTPTRDIWLGAHSIRAGKRPRMRWPGYGTREPKCANAPGRCGCWPGSRGAARTISTKHLRIPRKTSGSSDCAPPDNREPACFRIWNGSQLIRPPTCGESARLRSGGTRLLKRLRCGHAWLISTWRATAGIRRHLGLVRRGIGIHIWALGWHWLAPIGTPRPAATSCGALGHPLPQAIWRRSWVRRILKAPTRLGICGRSTSSRRVPRRREPCASWRLAAQAMASPGHSS